MANTFYTAYNVLKNFIEQQGLEIVNFSLIKQSPDRVTMWVNESQFSHFTCIKLSCTQFIIFGYDNNYKQTLFTGFDYADVNTPQLEKGN